MQSTLARQTASRRGVGSTAITTEWPTIVDAGMQGELVALINRVLEKETTIGFPGPLPPAQAWALMADMAAAVASEKKHVLLFRAADRSIIGHVLFTQSALPNCRHIGEVSRVFIHPEQRGVHIIKLGLNAVLDKADKLGIENIQLDVRAHTPIHRLWQSLGFLSIGIMKDYARVDGQSFDGCFMYQSVVELKRHKQRREALEVDGAATLVSPQ